MNIYSARVKACAENILTVKFMIPSKRNRFLLALMLTGLALLPTRSFSASQIEGYGSLQLCRGDNDDGTSMGASGQSKVDCNKSPKAAFSLNSAGNEKGALGYNMSNTQVTGYEDGTLKLIAKKAVEVNGKIDMKDNSIGQLKPGLLSKDSKDAINGSQLFSTNENVGKNADNILKNTQYIEKNHKELSSALTENKNSITELTNNINSGKSGLVRQSKTDASITVAAETNGESVSVSGIQGPRFLRDVKAGVNSNDAVNVSQLNKLLADNQMSVAPSSSKEKSQATKKDGLALGGGAKSTAEGAISIGTGSKAAGERGIALGHKANSGGNDSLALGAGASAPGKDAVALGTNSVADHDNSVSVGSLGHERKITNVAPGTHDTDAVNFYQINKGEVGLVRQSKTDGSITVAAETNGESVSVSGIQGPRFLRDVKAGVNSNDAVNVSQLKKLLADNQMSVAPSSSKEKPQATKKDGLALGGGAKSTAEGATAIGAQSHATGQRSVALGQHANSGGSNSVALGNGATAPGENAAALGANSIADRNNSVSVGSPGYERQITNVAPGIHDTDAANIAQLNQVRNTATSAHGIAQKNTSRINNLENQLSKTNKKIDRGLAASAALTGLFQPYGVGNVNFTAGMGGYGSSQAIAVGSGYRVNENAAVKAGLAYSGGNNVMYNASFNLEW